MGDVDTLPYDRGQAGYANGADAVTTSAQGTQPAYKKRERETWNTKLDFLLALIGFSVGLGNVWRFPYLCYKNGGGAFLIPYLICVIIGGVPILYLEIAIGQFMQQGGIKVWNIMPVMYGIGIATTIIVFLLDCYYNVILAWTFYFVFASMTSVLPWSHCDNEWNLDTCIDNSDNVTFPNSTDPATEFWERKVLGIQYSTGVEDGGGLKWDLCLCNLLAWIVVYLCIWKGIRTSGKVMYFTATMPYVLMLVLLVRGATLPGALDGIIFYVKPNWERMINIDVWVDAGTQIFFSYSIGLGTLTALGSYNTFRHNSYRDAYLFALANSGTSILSGFVIFSVLGFMAQKLGKEVSDVAKGGPGLAFIAYPQAVAEMPVAPLWSILFFFMVILLGLDSQFVGVEGFITALTDLFPQLHKGRRREIFIAIVCACCYLIGLSMVSYGGMYIFQLFDFYSGSRVILLVAFFEMMAIAWIYGLTRFYNDLKVMLGFSINWYMGISWLVSTPTFCLVMFGFVCYRYEHLTYGKNYKYPQEAIGISWFIALISISMIPIYAIYYIIKTQRRTNNFIDTLRFVTTPQIPPRGLTEEEIISAGLMNPSFNLEEAKGGPDPYYPTKDNKTYLDDEPPPQYPPAYNGKGDTTYPEIVTSTRF